MHNPDHKKVPSVCWCPTFLYILISFFYYYYYYFCDCFKQKCLLCKMQQGKPPASNSCRRFLIQFCSKHIQRGLANLTRNIIKEFTAIKLMLHEVLSNRYKYLCHMYSCDIVRLYTSIPTERDLEAIEYWIMRKRDVIPQRFTKEFMLGSIEFIF